MNPRIKKLQRTMKEKGLDTVLLTTQKDEEYNNDIYYYTGFKGWAVLVIRKNSVRFLVPEMEAEKAKKTGLKVSILKKGEKEKTLAKELKGSKKIGIDEIRTTVAQLKSFRKAVKARWQDVSDELFRIRSVKDEDEVKKIKKACKACDDIFDDIVNNFNFRTEKEIASFIDIEIRKKGMVPSFPAIVASGKNASIPHHDNSGRISKGFLLLDYGAKCDGYCSDMSRTIYLGSPSMKEFEEYGVLLGVQETCVSMATPGQSCGELDKFARDELGARFMHGLGHGVGLNIHEYPNNLPDSKDILEKGNVVTVEPGIYEEGKYGIRIEDTVLVTDKSPKILTKSTKNLIVLGLH